MFPSEENFEDPVLNSKVDIGFPFLRPSRSAELRQRLDHLKTLRKDSSLEKLARSNKRKLIVCRKRAGPEQCLCNFSGNQSG